MSEPPVPGKANLHNALAIAVDKRTQEPDKVLIEAVYGLRREVEDLRRQLAEANAALAGPDLFTVFDQEAS